ncbi:hypothetical protein MKW94_016306 [Papaver nudicaule]|uniref:Protein kinase domain-containing protein n=1 Tax=Papaver nudicaule TaxID=74823 RepID=A0AA41SJ83_PAPNU|nr:hypothetical protein [Papaver nudicaule]
MVRDSLVFLSLVLRILVCVNGKTDAPDVSALGVMFTSLNSPSKLNGWKSSGGDPCGDSWDGIKCKGSSVTEIKLSGLGLSGSMGYQLSSLTSVTYFDLSNNNLKGDIPYQLPPNVAHIDFSKNSLTGGVPYSISQMSDLKYLNLGNNKLSGQLSDMFGNLQKLTFMDLSSNSFSGNLPQSFGSLKNLEELHLENNHFTGSLDVLAKLQLAELDVENNKFSGSIPKDLKDITETGGNSWRSGGGGHGDGSSGGAVALNWFAIGGIIIGVLLAIVFILAFFASRSRRSSSSSHFLDEEKLSQRRHFSPLVSHELSNEIPSDFKDYDQRIPVPPPELKSYNSSASISPKSLQRCSSVGFKAPPFDRVKSVNDNEFGNRVNIKRSTSAPRAVVYTLSDLQSATGNFASGRLLGEGTIGRVYRAKLSDGKVMAAKKIDSSVIAGMNSEDFTEMALNISKLHHPNICEVLGYCSEQGHNLLIYEYFRNGSLHEFLHQSDDYGKPLTWNTRIRIALGTARAVEYLHEICSPSSVHKNIKSPNILLDAELNPRLSDCGLGCFYQRTSQNLGVGYNAPECTKPSAYTMKSDVYSFGVVMLELLTGRMPFDSKKPRSEQSLVRWATPQLHDIDALGKMVDPALHGLYPPKSLSRFADVIALCVQSEPEFRPPMSEVVQALVRLVQRSSMSNNASRRVDNDSDQSDYF